MHCVRSIRSSAALVSTRTRSVLDPGGFGVDLELFEAVMLAGECELLAGPGTRNDLESLVKSTLGHIFCDFEALEFVRQVARPTPKSSRPPESWSSMAKSSGDADAVVHRQQRDARAQDGSSWSRRAYRQQRHRRVWARRRRNNGSDARSTRRGPSRALSARTTHLDQLVVELAEGRRHGLAPAGQGEDTANCMTIGPPGIRDDARYSCQCS